MPAFFVLEQIERKPGSQTYKFLLPTELESNNLTRISRAATWCGVRNF